MRKNNEKPAFESSQLELLKKDPFGFLVMGYYSPKHLERQKQYAENSVRQPNELTRSFYKCSGIAQKLFVVCAEEFMKKNKTRKDRWISLEMSDVIFGLNIEDGKRTRHLFTSAVNEVADLWVILQNDEHGFHRLNLFEEVKYNYDWGTLKFKLTEKFATFLELEHKQGFTIFSSKIIGHLQSFYSMRYYEIAMSFYGFKGKVKTFSDFAKDQKIDARNSWCFYYTVDQLRALFLIKKDEYADVRNFIKKVVKNPIQELNEKVPSLEIKVEIVRKHRTQRGKVEGFVFWVTEKMQTLKISKSDSKQIKDEKKEINEEEKIIAENFERFNELFEEEKQQPALFGDGEFFARARALSRLKEELELA